MSAEVESRRFRTWESGAEANVARSWWLMVRYLVNRYIRTWYVWMVIVLGLFGALLGIFLLSLQGDPQYPTGVSPRIIHEAPMTFIGIAMGLFTLLVVAPSLAEDIRFNAQLFYFSKPLRVRDYMIGKNAFNFFGLAVVGLLPVLVLGAAAISIGPGDTEALRRAFISDGASQAEADRAIQEFRIEGVDSWAELGYVVAMPVLAVFSLSVGLVGITMAVSSFTRRAWHAAVGTVILVTGWSVLGTVAAERVQDATWRLYHPAGWLDAVVFLPFQHRFRHAGCVLGREGPRGGFDAFCSYYLGSLEHAAATIGWSHVLLVSTGVVGLLVAWIRLKRLEGAS